ncbi:MAG TPA: aminoglycoside phosphotransferase family protein, partial [Micromonosporaceae bacterium]
SVLRWLDAAGLGRLAVPLVAAEGLRMLLDHVPGADLFGAELGTRLGILADMHQIQRASASQVDQLLALGVPDLRAAPLHAEIDRVVAGYGGADPRLADLVAGLPRRLAAVAACGVPETLVHGDLHPGNVRGDHSLRRIIDWGDSFIGHPGFDILRLSEQLDPPEAAQLLDLWSRLWQQAVPGSDPDRAVELLRPVAALRNAVTYARFLANIEPSEHPYHRADVPDWLGRAAEFAAAAL